MFWVILIYFNIRNTLPKSGTFLLGHPVYSVGGPGGTLLYKGFSEKGELLFYKGTLFNGESYRHVKEGSGNRQLSSQGLILPETLAIDGELLKQSISRSLSLWEFCEGNLKGGLLYWEQ